MKKRVRYIVRQMLLMLLIAFVYTVDGLGQAWNYSLPVDVKHSIEKSDASKLSTLLAETVEISLPTGSGIYGRRQAEMVMADYLHQHRGVQMTVQREEKAEGSTRTISLLNDSKGQMTMTILFMQTGAVSQIKQIRIENRK
ncbi:MAG: DUF4783 domain-containing protein [Bacteroidales bacterium]|nr:DUF4783 domain-containing protein [Bacteroidales bacterium]